MTNPFDIFKKVDEKNIKEVFNFSKKIRAFEKRNSDVKRKSSLYIQHIQNHLKAQKKKQEEEVVKFNNKLDYITEKLNDIAPNLGNSLSNFEQAFKQILNPKLVSTRESYNNFSRKIKTLNISSHKHAKNTIKEKIKKRIKKIKKVSIMKNDSNIKRLNLELENLNAYIQLLNTEVVIPTDITDKNHKDNLRALLNVSFLNIINNEIEALEEIKERRYTNAINDLRLGDNKKHKKDFNTFRNLIKKSESSIQTKIDDFLKNHVKRLNQTCDFIEKTPTPFQHAIGHSPEYQAYYDNAMHNSIIEANMIDDLIKNFTNGIVDKKYIKNFKSDYTDRLKSINTNYVSNDLPSSDLYENYIFLDENNSENPITKNFSKVQTTFNLHTKKNKKNNVSKAGLSTNTDDLAKTIKSTPKKP